MSAYVVDKAHIDALVKAALGQRQDFRYWHNEEHKRVDSNNAEEIGAMLWNENVRSVSYRYPSDSLESLPGRIDSPWLTPYTYSFMRTPYREPVAVLKAIDCYEYQSCETPDWEQSEAFAFCRALRRHVIGRLPGYDEADWSIAEEAA